MKLKKLVEDVASVADGDYPTGFKMLGFVVYVSEHGAEDLLSRAMVSPRTDYRWVDTVKAAGWDSVLPDVRFKPALQYLSNLLLGWHQGLDEDNQIGEISPYCLPHDS